LNYLFCTTTIIEGVNTSAKNVVYFDKTKGYLKPIDYFDYNNIKGRSGRMMIHYVGRIYNFNIPPDKTSIIIDIPFFEQNKISDEILIHIEEKDVKNKETDQYKELNKLPLEEKELFKKSGVLVKGQKKILDTLEKEVFTNYSLLKWTGMPSYTQLSYILSLAWNNLIKVGETTRPMTLNKIVKVTFDYGHGQEILDLVNSNYSYFKTLKKYINKNDDDIFDEAVTDAFQILRHWFHYKVPKWLNVVSSLQQYVCEKNNLTPGNYTYYSSQLENDFVRENLSILVEFGIPKSAINKLQKLLPDKLNEDEILQLIIDKKLYDTSELSGYEKEKIIENL